LTAQPQDEACAFVIYFDFFFFFFFFEAMIVFPWFGDEPTAGLVQSQAKSRSLGPRPLAEMNIAIERSNPQSKKRK
jgi:hypothetical protein